MAKPTFSTNYVNVSHNLHNIYQFYIQYFHKSPQHDSISVFYNSRQISTIIYPG